jgi:hypothetical protein
MNVYELPEICKLGESDFVLRGKPGQYAIWSEAAQKGVDFKSLSGNALTVATRCLRLACAKHFPEFDKLAADVASLKE